MKLVIDIPSHVKNRLIFGVTYKDDLRILVEALTNGTPLPKGHGDLKDADIYKAEVYKYIAENKNSDDLYLAGCGDGAYHALHIYDYIPTIIKADGGEGDDLKT